MEAFPCHSSSFIQTLTVGFGISPNQPCGSWAITTGGDLHPALKNIDLLYIYYTPLYANVKALAQKTYYTGSMNFPEGLLLLSSSGFIIMV